MPTTDKPTKSKRRSVRFGPRVERQREKARAKRELARQQKNAAREAAGLPPLRARKTPQRRGSDRRTEQTVRVRMGEAIRAFEADTIELSKLILADQKLTDWLDNAPARMEALHNADRPAPSFAPALPKYHAILSQISNAIREIGKALDKLDDLDDKPRLQPLVPIDEAVTDDRVVSLLDGLTYQVITRSLRTYGISVHDYRRLFGLPNDFLLWTEQVKNTRARIITKKQVWKHSGKKSDAAMHVDEPNGQSVEGATSPASAPGAARDTIELPNKMVAGR